MIPGLDLRGDGVLFLKEDMEQQSAEYLFCRDIQKANNAAELNRMLDAAAENDVYPENPEYYSENE